jgi:hypothetical protein
MIKSITQMVVDGYESGVTDFMTRLGQAPAEVQQEFDVEIIQPILAVLRAPAVNEAAVLTITGHSDRVDTEGLTREQRRQQEFDASEARAASAAAGVQQRIIEQLPAPELTPDDFEAIAELAILPRPAGAAVLREKTDALSEDQRRMNRRVQFRVVRFQPS